MERAEKAKSPEMETAGLPPNDMKRFYVNGRHLLREIAGLYVLIPAGETDAPQNRITALNETGRFLWMQFQHPCTVERIGGTPTQPVYELKTEGPVEIGCVVLREDLTHGQRVEGFRILGIDEENKADYALFEGTCIGNKHICELEDPFAVQNPLTGHTNKKLSGVRVQITAARDEVFMREIYITKGKSVCEQK